MRATQPGGFFYSRRAIGGFMGTVAIFLDAGYVDKVMRNDFGDVRIDYQKLTQAIAAPDELLRAYYYNCLPYQSNPPTDDERQRFSRAHRFITALRNIPRFEIRLGKLAYRGTEKETGKPIYLQKRVDCMFGVDMALLAGKGKITNVAIFTGDSDLIPAIEAVKREGVLVTLWHGTNPRNSAPGQEILQVCDERKPVTQEFINRILRDRA
jgi:uncharacterized LabA/DUF88 family protein